MKTNLIYNGDSYSVLKTNFPEKCIDLVYLDPPFSFDPKYARLWYDNETMKMFEEMSKGDVRHFVDWLSRRVEQCHRVLKDTGSIFLHCDQKFGHYIKVELDNIFGRNNFQNEIIWHYQTGGASKRRFSRKHDNIFFYSKGNKWTFNPEEVKIRRSEKSIKRAQNPKGARIASDDVYKNPDDVFDIPSMNPMSSERLGYFTQKPEALLERIIKAGSNVNDIVLDPFCGCGTTIAIAYKLGRQWIGIDISSQACEIMKKRIESLGNSLNIPIIGLPLTTEDLTALSPFEFEDYICEMTNSKKTPHTGDKGIDGYFLGEIPLQVKQQEGAGRNIIDNFETALRRKHKNKGAVIAFSFTKNAVEEAARAKDDGFDIKLVEVKKLIANDYELSDFLDS